MEAKLPAEIYSVDRILAVSEELHSYSVYLSASRVQGVKAEAFDLSSRAEAVVNLIPEDQRTAEGIEAYRLQLEGLATTAPAVTLILAAQAKPGLKQELVNWLRANIHPGLLVNFRANPNIAGGIVIRTINHVYDCSFRQA
ncbi:MAG TPA: hypothetical protein VMR98_02270, partial [Candidatus Polarisedimenticolaceae bacterium]|nr:hypothetical protein [Candidatus Polarisedimenticolaceae bacterium]